ncbi:MAG: hypothetical protein WBQ18_15850, partial [Solirubrobacteraceae bacterium]
PMRAIATTAAYASEHPCAEVIGDALSVSALLWREPAMAGRVGFDGELEAYPPDALVRWIEFQQADTPGWFTAARPYALLIGSTIDHPQLVSRLEHLPHALVLSRGLRGAAVLNPTSRGPTCRSAPLGQLGN